MITAIVLNCDGEQTLKACLQSVSWCDEILVADDGSLDHSRSIAEECGATFIQLRKTPSFAEKRNQAARHASHEWILFVDRDEVVTSALRSAIEMTLQSSQADGYALHRRDVFLGRQLRYGETGQLTLVRLGKKNAGTWRRTVHEVWQIDGLVETIREGYLLHTPHPTLSDFLDKLNDYTELEVTERLQQGNPRKSTTLLQLFVFPGAKFFANYVLRLGFLDGWPGLIHAYWMSLHSLIVRIKILERLKAEGL